MDTVAVAAWVVARVAGDAELSGLLAGRFFPDAAPEGTPNPCGVYQVVEGDYAEVLEGGAVSAGEVGVQVRFYADTRMAADGLRERFRRLFQNLEPRDVTGPDGRVWRLGGTGFGALGNTFEVETGDFGSVGLLVVGVG